jgi:hypothetical protein
MMMGPGAMPMPADAALGHDDSRSMALSITAEGRANSVATMSAKTCSGPARQRRAGRPCILSTAACQSPLESAALDLTLLSPTGTDPLAKISTGME